MGLIQLVTFLLFPLIFDTVLNSACDYRRKFLSELIPGIGIDCWPLLVILVNVLLVSRSCCVVRVVSLLQISLRHAHYRLLHDCEFALSLRNDLLVDLRKTSAILLVPWLMVLPSLLQFLPDLGGRHHKRPVHLDRHTHHMFWWWLVTFHIHSRICQLVITLVLVK